MSIRSVDLPSGKWSVEEVGQGRVVLLVHGFPLDHSMWRHQIASLSKHYRVIAPDLAGFGQSAPITRFTMASLAEDCAALLDSLEVKEKVCFCGLSMGGYVGWEFWSKYASRLDRLIACDTRALPDTAEAADGRRKLAEKVKSEGMTPVVEGMLPKLFGPAAKTKNAAEVEATKQVMSRTKPDTTAAALLAMAERKDFAPQLKDMNVKSLLICGENDVITPPKEMREIAAAMPDAKFVQVDGAGHMSPLESPTFVTEQIVEFLKDWR